MCEFCSNPFDPNRDASNADFQGFFSADAINAAVQQANALRSTNAASDTDNSDDDGTSSDEDSDGT